MSEPHPIQWQQWVEMNRRALERFRTRVATERNATDSSPMMDLYYGDMLMLDALAQHALASSIGPPPKEQQLESDKTWLRAQRDVAEEKLAELRAHVAPVRGLLAAKYLNPACAEHGCQWLASIGPQEPQCANAGHCPCDIGTRHFWFDAFCREREKAAGSAPPGPQEDLIQWKSRALKAEAALDKLTRAVDGVGEIYQGDSRYNQIAANWLLGHSIISPKMTKNLAELIGREVDIATKPLHARLEGAPVCAYFTAVDGSPSCGYLREGQSLTPADLQLAVQQVVRCFTAWTQTRREMVLDQATFDALHYLVEEAGDRSPSDS